MNEKKTIIKQIERMLNALGMEDLKIVLKFIIALMCRK